MLYRKGEIVMETKVCSKCKKELPLENFRWKNQSQGKKHSQCKQCQSQSDKKHYQESKERREAVRERADIQKDTNLEYVNLKKQQGCMKCGENRIWVLDFHHKNPQDKFSEIAHMIKSSSIKKLAEEIEKCVLLCANCHRDFHYLEKEKGITLEEYMAE